MYRYVTLENGSNKLVFVFHSKHPSYKDKAKEVLSKTDYSMIIARDVLQMFTDFVTVQVI